MVSLFLSFMTMGFTSENSGKSKIYFHAHCSNSKIILMQDTLCTNPYTSNYVLSSAMPQHQNILVISVIFSSVWIFRDEGLLWHRYIPRSLFKQQDYSYARGDVRQDGTGNLFDDRRRIYGLLSVSICNINSFDFPYNYYNLNFKRLLDMHTGKVWCVLIRSFQGRFVLHG